MEIGITRMSSKGQIVIPSSMRKDCPEGEELLIIREGKRFILKPLDEFKPALREDILFAEKTEQAFAEYEKGSFKRKEKREFLDELASW
jgi:bifunctional DNA-binding transcriptional regulator/antitoxin component of YhaV-PrlF toxin-antitoxin module